MSIGLAAAWCLGVEPLSAIAVVGLVYYPLTAAWLGRGLALSWRNDPQRIPASWRTARASVRYPAAVNEPVVESPHAATRHRVVVGLDEPEPEPIARVLHLRKGSAA
jgi:hypothetical protein